MKRYAIYSRKSKFTSKGESTENQIALCRNYIENNFGKCFAESAFVYEDEGFSGKSTDRPKFKKMISDAYEHKFSSIIVYRLDRISRNICDFTALTKLLNSLEIDFISIKENFDTSSPTGRAMMYISSVFSQLERETIAERIKDNMKELSKTGRWLGGITPFGFCSKEISYESLSGKNKKMFCLSEIDSEIEIVKIIFSKFLETRSIAQVERYLASKHYLTRSKKHFSKFTIKNILSNPVYMKADETAYILLKNLGCGIYSSENEFDGIHGISAYNRTYQQTGKSNKINPPQKWIVSVGKHKGIISGKSWFEIKKFLNKKSPIKTPQKSQSLLSGLVVCQECSNKMRPKKTSEKSFSYVCTQKEKSRKKLCSSQNISGPLLDKMVISELFSIDENFSILIKCVEDYKKNLIKHESKAISDSENIKAKIEENERKIKRLIEALSVTSNSYAEKHIVSEINVLCSENSHLENLLSLKPYSSTYPSHSEIMDSLLSFEFLFNFLSLDEKRNIIKLFISSVSAAHRTALITLSSENQTLNKDS